MIKPSSTSPQQQQPQQSNTRSEAQKERVSTACTYCRYRKVKCDGGKPSCSFCMHMGRSNCVYAKVSEEENQNLRKRKRELRARRAAEKLQEKQQQEQQIPSSSSPAIPILIPSSTNFNLDSASSSSSGVQQKRRRSSVPRQRARAKTTTEIESSNSTFFSLSAPTLDNFSSPSRNSSNPTFTTLSGLPTELSNTISPNFLEDLLTPRSSIASLLEGTSGLELGQSQNNLQQLSNTDNEVNAFNVMNSSTFDWSFGQMGSTSTVEQSDNFLVPDRQHKLQSGSQSHPQPQSIFAVAATNNTFLNPNNGTFDMTIPNFNGPPFQLTSIKASTESNVLKNDSTLISRNEEGNNESGSGSGSNNHFLDDGSTSIRESDLISNLIKSDLKTVESTKQDDDQKEQKPEKLTILTSTSSTKEQECENSSNNFNFRPVSEGAQSIFTLWPTHLPDNSTNSNFLPSPLEPSSMPEIKRFLHTRKNPFVFNPIVPLAMSLPSNERLPWESFN